MSDRVGVGVGAFRSLRSVLEPPGVGEKGQPCDFNELLLVLLLLVSVVVREVVLLRDERADDDKEDGEGGEPRGCLLYTSPSPRDQRGSRMPSSA